MLILDSHQKNHPDALQRPSFGWMDKLRRLKWNFARILFFRWIPVPLHDLRCWMLRRFGARIGRNNFIYPDCRIWAPWLLETEDVVTIGPRAEIYNPGGVYLGHHTIISQDAYLCGATHDYNSADFTYVKKLIRTDAYAWICARATVLPGVHCHQGAVLGASSVTSRDLEAWTVYAGNPARAVRPRSQAIAQSTLS